MHFRNIFSTTSKGPVAKNSEDQVPILPMSFAVIGGLSSSAPTGDSIPTTADARNNASIFQRFRLAQETPVPFHPGFRTNDENGREDVSDNDYNLPDCGQSDIASICIPGDGAVFDPPTGEDVDLEVNGQGVNGSTHTDSPEAMSADKGSVSSSASAKWPHKWGKSPRGIGDRGPQPLGVKPSTNQWTRKPGGKWDYIDERFGKIYTKENQEYAALISPGQWKRRDSHKLVWVKVGGGEFVVKEEEAKNSLLEGVTSRKGNDLEWINVSDDRFVVREKEDNCSERSNGTEEKKNNEPENPENNDECHML
jgi:hypothetical protein